MAMKNKLGSHLCGGYTCRYRSDIKSTVLQFTVSKKIHSFGNTVYSFGRVSQIKFKKRNMNEFEARASLVKGKASNFIGIEDNY